jgi:hypothetical protein
MNTLAPTQVAPDRYAMVAELSTQSRIRGLANFLGLNAESVAQGLVEAIERDRDHQHELLQAHLSTR